MARRGSGRGGVGLSEEFAFGMGDFWTSIGNIAMATYLTMFYTDVIHLNPANVAFMLLLVRLAAAIWDVVVGVLIDRTRTRWGRARPWMLAGGVLYGPCFFLLFLDPCRTSGGRLGYAWVSFILVNLAYSTVNVAYASLTSLMTSDVGEKTRLNIFRMTTANIGAMLVYLLAMPLIARLGGGTTGWGVFFGCIAFMIPFGYWYTFRMTREQDLGGGREDRVTLGDQFAVLSKNRYWWITLGLNFLLWIYNGIANGMAAYLAKYVLGNPGLTSALGFATVLPMILGLPLSGAFIARFGKRTTSLAGLVLVVAGSLLICVDSSSLGIFFLSILLRMTGMVPLNASLNSMSADVVDYGQWRYGVRSDGMVFSSSSFSMKVAMGVSSAAIAWVLSASGYRAESSHQTAGALSAMVGTFVWVPLVMVLLIAILLARYDLDDKMPRIVAESSHFQTRENERSD